MKRFLVFALLLQAMTGFSQQDPYLKKGLAALPTAPAADDSSRALRYEMNGNPRLSGLYGIRAGKATYQLSVTPAGIMLMIRDSNNVLRGLSWDASKIVSGQFATGRIPDLPQSKITGLGGAMANKADLVGGKVPLEQLSAVVISDVFSTSSQSGMLALTAERGDICIRSDIAKTFVLSTDSPTTLADWKELPVPAGSVISVAGKTGVVTIDKGDVGLGNVDNTSDLSKPISTSAQTALDAKASLTSLNSHTSNTSNPHSVTKSQVGLGNVDNTSDLSKPISTSAQAALDAKASITALSSHTSNTSNPHSVTKSQVGLGNVDNTSDANKPVSTATQTALDLKANTADLSETIDDRVAALITVGSNVTVTYNDAGNALAISSGEGNTSTVTNTDFLVNGVAVSSTPLLNVEANKALTSGTGYSYKVTAPVSATVTKVVFEVTTGAGTLSGGSSGNNISIFNSSGTQLGWADCSTGGAFTGTGIKSVNLASSVAITAGTTYYLVVVCTASTNLSLAASNAISLINANLGSAPYRHQSKSSFTNTNGGSITPGSGWSATVSQIAYLGFAQ